MSLTVKENRTFLPVPEGSHSAYCYAVIDLGMQHNTYYDTTLPTVIMGWELSNQLTQEKKPYVHWQRYTASLNARSSLRALLEGWQGRTLTSEELAGFELKKLLGTTCYLTIRHVLNLQTQQRWAKVIAICPLPDLRVCTPPVNTHIYFDCDNYTASEYLAVPESIRKHITLPLSLEERVSHPQPARIATTISRYYPPDPDEPQPDVDA